VAIIKITDFGGLLPRVEPRALPPGAAQVNSNLLATSNSFRPLQDDSTVATGVSGAQTLYRLSRDAAGTLRTGDTTGWIAEAADKSYVKGQINDDATERTYVSLNDGSAPPRAIDALGANRLMGVPSPATITVELNKVASFTQEDALNWSNTTLIPDMTGAIYDSLLSAGSGLYVTTGPTPVAGPYSAHGLGWSGASNDWWNLQYGVSQAVGIAAGLNDPRVTPELNNAAGTLTVRITCLPRWGIISNGETLKAAFRGIRNPVTDEQLMSEDLVQSYANLMVARFDPAEDSLQSLRTQLDVAVQAFKAAVEFVLLETVADPVQPAEPTTPYYEPGQDTEGINAVMSADWLAYRDVLQVWIDEVKFNQRNEVATLAQKTARVSKIVDLQAQALGLTQEIERTYNNLKTTALQRDLESFVSNRNYDFNQGTDETSNVIEIDPDRIIDTRFYFATFTSDWGEESAPGPVSGLLEIDQYSSATVTVASPPAGRNIASWTLYRSAVGNAATGFQRVMGEVIATLNYTDELKGEELGELCPTLTWAEPPFRIDAAASTASNLVAKGSNPYLRGLTGMPNGVMAGFIDNYVAFSDPYHPYAWPVEYQIPLGFEIVGLGVFGSSLFVGTYANPSIISGSDSASMSEIMLDDSQACLSAGSIVSAEGGVLYASPDGICFASLNGVKVITTALFAREDWQLLNPESIVAAMHEGVYYMWYAGNGGGCYALDTVAKKLTHVDMTASAVFADSLTDGLFYCEGTAIKRAFAAGRREGVWKSSRIVLPAQSPFAWLQIDADYDNDQTVEVKWYGDSELQHTAVLSSIRPVRLPSGCWREHEIEITSTARITKVMLAGHTLELQAS
jgi:hypothetical protein